MVKAILGNTFVRFCTVGAVSSVIDIAVLTILVELFGVSVLIAAAFGLIAGSINGYILNKKLTFKDTATNIKTQYLQYFMVSFVGLLLTLLFMKFFIGVLLLHYLIAKLITIVLVTAWNFSINYFFVFTTR